MDKSLELVDTYARLEGLDISVAARAFMAGYFYNNFPRNESIQPYTTMDEARIAAQDVATIDPLFTIAPTYVAK